VVFLIINNFKIVAENNKNKNENYPNDLIYYKKNSYNIELFIYLFIYFTVVYDFNIRIVNIQKCTRYIKFKCFNNYCIGAYYAILQKPLYNNI